VFSGVQAKFDRTGKYARVSEDGLMCTGVGGSSWSAACGRPIGSTPGILHFVFEVVGLGYYKAAIGMLHPSENMDRGLGEQSQSFCLFSSGGEVRIRKKFQDEKTIGFKKGDQLTLMVATDAGGRSVLTIQVNGQVAVSAMPVDKGWCVAVGGQNGKEDAFRLVSSSGPQEPSAAVASGRSQQPTLVPGKKAPKGAYDYLFKGARNHAPAQRSLQLGSASLPRDSPVPRSRAWCPSCSDAPWRHLCR
jgi:hypothetical protein